MTDALIHQETRLPLDVTSPADLEELVLALLLIAPAPATVDELAAGAEVEVEAVEAAVSRLEMRTAAGWVVQRHGDRLQLVTAPRYASHVRRFLGSTVRRGSRRRRWSRWRSWPTSSR
jgi:chromosome segregation and condensation protein ScpB